MDLQLKDRVAIVTAASQGLGRASALALAREGASVAVCARNKDALTDLVDEIGSTTTGQALAMPLDLSDFAAIDRALEAVVDAWGRIDILIGNAPGPPPGAVMEITEEQWRDALEMNVMSMVRLTRSVVPHMQRNQWGRIVYITTTGILTVQPNMVLSNATRLAVYGITKTLAQEVAQDNILVNTVCPGPLATERMQEVIRYTAENRGISLSEAEAVWLDEVPLARMGRPEDLASMVALLCSDACSYTTGAAIPIDGGKARGY
jgi:3-oxoacyl-[acyl-carrier protein] reductase